MKYYQRALWKFWQLLPRPTRLRFKEFFRLYALNVLDAVLINNAPDDWLFCIWNWEKRWVRNLVLANMVLSCAEFCGESPFFVALHQMQYFRRWSIFNIFNRGSKGMICTMSTETSLVCQRNRMKMEFFYVARGLNRFLFGDSGSKVPRVEVLRVLVVFRYISEQSMETHIHYLCLPPFCLFDLRKITTISPYTSYSTWHSLVARSACMVTLSMIEGEAKIHNT